MGSTRRGAADSGERATREHAHPLVNPTGGPHEHVFFVHADSGVHRLAPECKLAATLLFVFAVVATPREAFWAFGLHAAILLCVAVLARVPLRRLARRMTIEMPFLAFAVFLPIVGRDPRVDVWFFSLSVAGLWGAWNIVIKGTLGRRGDVAAARHDDDPGATACPGTAARASGRRRHHRIHDPIRRRAPDDLRRMRIARESRGAAPALAAAGCGRWRAPRGHCSSGPTSAASGCTSPCWRAATVATPPSTPPASGAARRRAGPARPRRRSQRRRVAAVAAA